MVPEATFLGQVRAFAVLHGWRVYHTHDSRRSEPGFPDLVMVRKGRLVFAELKAEGGRFRPGQKDWLADLGDVGAPVAAYLWKPSNWDAIEEVLS